MTTVSASTSLILVTTSNNTGPYTVNFPNISTTGRIITVRDNDGFASTSNAIVLQPISGATFQGVSGTLTINQPFGFITLNSQANGVYGILNTFAFPAGSATANVSNVVASNVTANTFQASTLIAQSTVQLRDRATGVFNSLFTSSGQLILNNSFVGQVSAADLTSTVNSLGTVGYLSTAPTFVSTQSISSLQTNFLSAGSMTVGSFNPALINTSLVITSVLSAGLTNISSLRTNARRIALGSNAATAGTAQGIDSVAIGTAAANQSQGATAVAIGSSAGTTSQSQNSVAIGTSAGATIQGANSVAVGLQAGLFQQGASAVSIGDIAGTFSQGTCAVAVGVGAGSNSQAASAVAIGDSAGYSAQGTGSIAIGQGAAYGAQGANAVSIGHDTGQNSQGTQAVAIGYNAGKNSQGANSVAVGLTAGSNAQGTNAVAIGNNAGASSQGGNAIAIGINAAATSQGINGIAIGNGAADISAQGQNAIAIGSSAGKVAQGAGALSFGNNAGFSNQGVASIAFGSNAGSNFQNLNSIAVGIFAGSNRQGSNAIAIGTNAGSQLQSTGSIAIGFTAGQTNQNSNAVAMGFAAGNATQGDHGISIGRNAGLTTQGASAIAIGAYAGQTTQGTLGIAIGSNAGASAQATGTIAIGYNAGATTQSLTAIAIGGNAGQTTQGISGVAIGGAAGQTSQGYRGVSIGALAGNTTQGSSAVAIGDSAGTNTQGANAVAIGINAGSASQGGNAIAIGVNAGQTSQQERSIAIGENAGQTSQQTYGTAIGFYAGQTSQSTFATAIGYAAGFSGQGQDGIAIGRESGQTKQGIYAVAIGYQAGQANQGQDAVAIGRYAGSNNQSNNTIVLNATGVTLNTTASSATYIKPIRQNLALNSNMGSLYYTNATGELTYGPTIVSTFSSVTVASNVGIGTTNSLYQLEVNGSMRLSNATQTAQVIIEPYSTNYCTVGAYSGSFVARNLILNKDGGNVGIGTISPQYTLDVNGSAQITTSGDDTLYLYRTQNNNSFGTGILFNLNNSASSKIRYSQIYGGIQTNTAGSEAGYIGFACRYPGNTGINTTGYNQPLVLYSNCVGINFAQGTYPGFGFHANVSSSVFNYQRTDIGGGFKLEFTGANLNIYKSGSSDTVINNTGGGQLQLGTNNSVIYINGSASGNNNVGIGRASPATRLVVDNPGTTGLTGLAVNSADVNVIIGNYGGGNAGSIQVTSGGSISAIGTSPYSLNIQPLGGATSFGGNVAITGTLSKGGGSFEIQHPVLKNSTLVHSFIEGPRCDLIYRGKKRLSSGIAVVDLEKESTGNGATMAPGTFAALCTNPQTYLQNNESFDRVIGSVSANILTIRSENQDSKAAIDWMVIAERHDPFIKTWDRTDSNGLLILEHAKA